MEPSSNPTPPAPVAAARDNADFQNETSPATSSLPSKPGTQPALPRQVVIGAVVVAAALPAILLGVIVLLMASANYNFFDWME